MSFNLFPRAASGVSREIRGKTYTFYPVHVWAVWSKHLRMLGGLMAGISELVAVFSSKPKGETWSTDQAGEGITYNVKPVAYKDQEAWSNRLAAALKKVADEAGKDGIVEAFCLTVLDSLRDPDNQATQENAQALAQVLDFELLTELGIGLFSASLQNLSTPLKAWIERVTGTLKATVQSRIENSLSGSPESQESESLIS
jgi:hypothetical protein